MNIITTRWAQFSELARYLTLTLLPGPTNTQCAAQRHAAAKAQRLPVLPTARVMSDRIPATFRVAAAAGRSVLSRRDASRATRIQARTTSALLTGTARPLHVYMDNHDLRRTRMAGSFSDVCAALDQLVRLQECAD